MVEHIIPASGLVEIDMTDRPLTPPFASHPSHRHHPVIARDIIWMGQRPELAEEWTLGGGGHPDSVAACAHNASVCRRHGQADKKKVWDLLSLAVAGHEDDGTGDGGAGGLLRGSPAAGLFANLRRFYRRTGDIQILATMMSRAHQANRFYADSTTNPSGRAW